MQSDITGRNRYDIGSQTNTPATHFNDPNALGDNRNQTSFEFGAESERASVNHYNMPTPYSGGKKKLVIFVVGILAVGGGTVGTMHFTGFFDSDEKEFLLQGEWTESSGDSFKIRSSGKMVDYGCDDAAWTIDGNETSFYYDCTAINPGGEELWRETTFSFVIDGDVVILKHLSIENQDGLEHSPDDLACMAWVDSSVANNAEEWNQTVSSIVMPAMCQSINDL